MGEGDNVIIYIAGRPKWKEVDIGTDTEGVKARE